MTWRINDDWTLSDGKEWATMPLLDKANIGKHVVARWNGNKANQYAAEIVGIGRTNLHIASYAARPTSARVEGGTARAEVNGYSVYYLSVESARDEDEKERLVRSINQHSHRLRWLSLDALRQFNDMLDEARA